MGLGCPGCYLNGRRCVPCSLWAHARFICIPPGNRRAGDSSWSATWGHLTEFSWKWLISVERKNRG